jgi:hypothetical protein
MLTAHEPSSTLSSFFSSVMPHRLVLGKRAPRGNHDSRFNGAVFHMRFLAIDSREVEEG